MGSAMRRWMTLGGAAVVCMTAAPATALINPNFTPVDLVNDAEVILKVSLGKVALEDGKTLPARTIALPVTKVTVLQGQKDAPAKLQLLLDGGIREINADLVNALTGPEADRAMIFYGDFSAAKETEDPDKEQPVAMIHIGTYWFALVRGSGDTLVTEKDDLRLKEVWAGSDVMLERVIRYVLDDLRADVPVTAEVTWNGETILGAAGGKIHGLQAVELTGRTAPGLFVMSPQGDRFYVATAPGKFDDLTGRLKLTTKSVAAAWGDFDGDGLLDLVSWDGQSLTFCRMTESGALAATPTGLKIDRCISLTPAGSGKTSRLVAATPGGPVLAERGRDGAWKSLPLGKAAGLGKAGPCAVADVTGDGIANVVQIFAGDVLLAAGAADGTFAGAKVAWSNPNGTKDRVLVSDPVDVLTADYDADGQIDLLVVGTGPGDVQLLRNTGGMFLAAVAEAGEITYNTGGYKPNGAIAWDVNNDGREEFIVTSAELNLLPFFNRGFRTFGYARMLELAGSDRPGAGAINKGQQGGVAADFDSDGMQDIALAAADGRVVVLHITPTAGAKLALRVALPQRRRPRGECDGLRRPALPRHADRRAGQGRPIRQARKGPLTLKWTDLAGKPQSKQVIVMKPTRFELPVGDPVEPR